MASNYQIKAMGSFLNIFKGVPFESFPRGSGAMHNVTASSSNSDASNSGETWPLSV